MAHNVRGQRTKTNKEKVKKGIVKPRKPKKKQK